MMTSDTPCAYCGMLLHLEQEVWVDHTGGDCCSGDDDLNNENQTHTLVRREY